MDTRSTNIARRWFLQKCGVGLGSAALGSLLATEGFANTDPLAVKAPHFAPKAKNVIYLFMAGGPSHLELFDYKPQLEKFDGTLPPKELLEGYRAAFINPNSTLLGPKATFAKYGQSGADISNFLPYTSEIVDEIAIVKSMQTDSFNHAPAQILMSTGSPQFGRPSLGAWTTYGLGSESQDLPAFVVFSSGSKGPSGGNSNWGAGFLPTVYQGVQFRSAATRSCICRTRQALTTSCSGRRWTCSAASTACGWMRRAIRKLTRASTPSRWRFGCRIAHRN